MCVSCVRESKTESDFWFLLKSAFFIDKKIYRPKTDGGTQYRVGEREKEREALDVFHSPCVSRGECVCSSML